MWCDIQENKKHQTGNYIIERTHPDPHASRSINLMKYQINLFIFNDQARYVQFVKYGETHQNYFDISKI